MPTIAAAIGRFWLDINSVQNAPTHAPAMVYIIFLKPNPPSQTNNPMAIVITASVKSSDGLKYVTRF
jgi:hypothetical protein